MSPPDAASAEMAACLLQSVSAEGRYQIRGLRDAMQYDGQNH